MAREVDNYPYARYCIFGGSETHACYAVGFLVKEDNVCDGANFGAFVANVVFDVEDGGGVFLYS